MEKGLKKTRRKLHKKCKQTRKIKGKKCRKTKIHMKGGWGMSSIIFNENNKSKSGGSLWGKFKNK